MELGMIGLGRMGGNMAQRLLQGGHRIVAYDPNSGQSRPSSSWAGPTFLCWRASSESWRRPEPCG